MAFLCFITYLLTFQESRQCCQGTPDDDIPSAFGVEWEGPERGMESYPL